jgi:predicted nucleic-acid-binding protein
MKVTADTNVLIRAAVQDDLRQARKAAKILAEADVVAVPVPVLCEFVWVLRRGYKKPVTELKLLLHHLLRCHCASLEVCVQRLSLSPDLRRIGRQAKRRSKSSPRLD